MLWTQKEIEVITELLRWYKLKLMKLYLCDEFGNLVDFVVNNDEQVITAVVESNFGEGELLHRYLEYL